jgi:hypothetical protein
MNTDPSQTRALLDILQPLGFDDSAFHLIHHMQRATIASHRDYCLERSIFKENGTNPKVQRRLELILEFYKAGRFKGESSDQFQQLAKYSVVKCPF